MAESAKLKEKLYVSEMMLKKLYVQNKELTEKLDKANTKMQQMDTDYRKLQKEHLNLQQNIQNRLIGNFT